MWTDEENTVVFICQGILPAEQQKLLLSTTTTTPQAVSLLNSSPVRGEMQTVNLWKLPIPTPGRVALTWGPGVGGWGARDPPEFLRGQ